jgi:hypothetical protein
MNALNLIPAPRVANAGRNFVPHPCGTEPSPGGSPLSSFRPANLFKNVCGQIAERDGLVSACLHEGLNSRGGLQDHGR